MAEEIDLPSLDVVANQVAVEREIMNSHAESLDSKAGVVLGFAGVLVGLGATAQSAVSDDVIFQVDSGLLSSRRCLLQSLSCLAAIRFSKSLGYGRTTSQRRSKRPSSSFWTQRS